MKRGMELILAERRRQVEVLGYSVERDKGNYQGGVLRRAAAAYEEAARFEIDHNKPYSGRVPVIWPWHESYFKTTGGAVRMLAKAGALHLAEDANYESHHPGEHVADNPMIRDCADLIDQIFGKLIGGHLLGERVLANVGRRLREVRVDQLSPEALFVRLTEVREGKFSELGWFPVREVELLEVLAPVADEGREG